jgi:hypothetical protein
MYFRLIEVTPEQANVAGINPGFMYLPLPEKIRGTGKTQAEIREIVLWANAAMGYLGVNYHVWPDDKKRDARLRLFVCAILRFHSTVKIFSKQARSFL